MRSSFACTSGDEAGARHQQRRDRHGPRGTMAGLEFPRAHVMLVGEDRALGLAPTGGQHAAQQPVVAQQQQQRRHEHQHARQVVHESLGRFFPAVIGHEHQRQDPQHVGGHRDGHDAEQDGGNTRARRWSRQVQVQQAEGEEAVDGVEARTGIGHQHRMVAHREHHALAHDRITQPLQQRLDDHGNEILQRRCRHLQQESRQRNHEEKKK
jgi:hypothetical protein